LGMDARTPRAASFCGSVSRSPIAPPHPMPRSAGVVGDHVRHSGRCHPGRFSGVRLHLPALVCAELATASIVEFALALGVVSWGVPCGNGRQRCLVTFCGRARSNSSVQNHRCDLRRGVHGRTSGHRFSYSSSPSCHRPRLRSRRAGNACLFGYTPFHCPIDGGVRLVQELRQSRTRAPLGGHFHTGGVGGVFGFGGRTAPGRPLVYGSATMTPATTDSQQRHSKTGPDRSGRYRLWRVFMGPIIWTLCFVALYGAHGLACLWLAPTHTGTVGVKRALLIILLASVLRVGCVTWCSLLRV